MNKIILKNSIKEIKNSFRRFLSLLLISMLGVGFFAGVKATTPDMQKTIDNYFDKEELFDIKIVSTLGLTKDDIEALKSVDDVREIYGSYSKDVFININDADLVVKVMELQNDINKVKLKSGNLPQNTKECVIEDTFASRENVKIGDYLQLKEDLGEDEESNFYNTKLKVVGTVDSPLYISNDKGTTTLGSGKLSYFLCVPKENINSDIYTEIYLKVANSKEMDTTSDKYSNYIDNVVNNIEKIKEVRQNSRYDSLIKEANEKLADSQKEFDEKKADGEKELEAAEKEILEGEKKLAKAQKELADNRKDVDSKFTDAQNQLTEAGNKLSSAEAEYNEKKKEAEEGFKEAEAQIEKLKINLDQVMLGLEEVNAQYNMVVLALQNPKISSEEKAKYEATKIILEQTKEELGATGKEITAGIKIIETEITKGKAQLDEAHNQILSGYNELNNGWAELNSQRKEANSEFSKAEKEIEKAKKELADGKKEYEDGKKEFDEKILEAENKLIDARQKVTDIENPKWYILDRSSNNGYESYINDTKNIDKLGDVFPVIFFVIAVLISLTSMSRMVEEQRIELGTMKALGYSNLQIIIKYMVYALFATVIGGIIGMIIGFNLIPYIIMTMYQMMYATVVDLIIEFNMNFAVLGLGIMIICTLGATIYSSIKELSSEPASLMRPKPPKNGKRVFLEKIPFIWDRLGFTEKVTVRNMFRYKKRFLMTIIGIMSCTALILVGFGLKDSISNLMNFQYEDVCNYDLMLSLKTSLTETEINNLKDDLEEKKEINKCVETHIVSNDAKSEYTKKQVEVQVVVAKDIDEFAQVLNLNNLKTSNIEKLSEDKVCITQKAAELLKVTEGDKVTLVDSDGNEFEVTIQSVVENYVYHYVYMSKALFEKVYKEDYGTNLFYVKTIDLDEKEQNRLNSDILSNSKISSLTSTSYLRQAMDDMIVALNKVVYVLIVSAGLLAFVVLYNLANVNISERKRELATIKVLGFYDNEVYDYITKEIVLLTVIGIMIGLVAGIGLSGFILKTCEIELLIFKNVIEFSSYIYSIIITVVFTIIVNIMTYFTLKKVDMIESLKSVE